jgi:hypothetical protein
MKALPLVELLFQDCQRWVKYRSRSRLAGFIALAALTYREWLRRQLI